MILIVAYDDDRAAAEGERRISARGIEVARIDRRSRLALNPRGSCAGR